MNDRCAFLHGVEFAKLHGKECNECEHIVHYKACDICRKTNGRVTFTDVLIMYMKSKDGTRRCMNCKHVHKLFSCATCLDCLGTEDLCNFVRRE